MLGRLLKHLRAFAFVAVVAVLVLPYASPHAAEDETEAGPSTATGPATDELLQRGRTIYSESCATCHGDDGQGVEEAYSQPLIGDDSIGELSKLITDTMPEGEPEQCAGENADAVATYIQVAH